MDGTTDAGESGGWAGDQGQTREDAHLEILGGVAGELENLGGEVLCRDWDGAGFEVSVEVRFLGGSGEFQISRFRAGRGEALHVGDVRTKDGSGVDGGGGADAAAGGSAVLLVGTGIEGGTEVSVRFAKSSCWRWAH